MDLVSYPIENTAIQMILLMVYNLLG